MVVFLVKPIKYFGALQDLGALIQLKHKQNDYNFRYLRNAELRILDLTDTI